jgi:hypothetical protein
VLSFAQPFVFAIPILLPILCEEEIVIRRGQRDEELTDKLEFWREIVEHMERTREKGDSVS